MAEEPHAPLAGEGGDGVGAVEAERAVGLDHVLHLHLPLGGELGEVGGGQRGPGGVADLRGLDRDADGEGGERLEGRAVDGLGGGGLARTGGQGEAEARGEGGPAGERRGQVKVSLGTP